MKNIIKNTLSEKAFFQVNKILLQYLGSHEAAIVLAHYLELQENLFGGKEFYQQQERVMDNCMISEFKLRNVNTLLQDLEILSIKKRGLPAKNYYYVNLDKLAEILDSTTLNNKVTSTGKTQSQRKDLILEKNNNLLDINDNRIDNDNNDDYYTIENNITIDLIPNVNIKEEVKENNNTPENTSETNKSLSKPIPDTIPIHITKSIQNGANSYKRVSDLYPEVYRNYELSNAIQQFFSK